jgi:hypothetical protein
MCEALKGVIKIRTWLCPPTTIARIFIFRYDKIMNNYYMSLFAGLGDVCVMELKSRARLESREVLKFRGGELIFVKTGEPSVLMSMRTIEDVFVLLGRVTLSGGVEDLKLLGKVPAFAQNLSHGLSTRASMQSRHQAGTPAIPGGGAGSGYHVASISAGRDADGGGKCYCPIAPDLAAVARRPG